MVFTKQDALELAELYGYYKQKGADVFAFRGQRIVTNYAYYQLEYLNNRMFTDDKTQIPEAIKKGKEKAESEGR